MLNEIKQWSTETFPNQATTSVTHHLNEELIELYQVCDGVDRGEDVGERSVAEEIADCIILLVALAGIYGIDIEEAIKNKHEINRTRTFKYDEKRGYHKRVREVIK